jgi:hypothetical protein
MADLPLMLGNGCSREQPGTDYDGCKDEDTDYGCGAPEGAKTAGEALPP